jgi:hypothetical protein
VQNRLFCHVGCKYRYAPARRAHARNWGARPRTRLWELIGWCRGVERVVLHPGRPATGVSVDLQAHRTEPG